MDTSLSGSAAAANVLLPFDLASRQHETRVGTSLGALADALVVELERLVNADLADRIPTQKARLTKIGGRCPVHGTYLEFNPWTPHEHRCIACDKSYVAREHDDWWAMGAQLWIAERAVHAAALFVLRGDPRHRQLAERILSELSARYTTYPNQDNVLGPTRPFFSTYLESIWLLNICQSLALLEQAGSSRIGAAVREQLIAPSRALIAGFNEGRSNRQVWNAVAMLAASRLLNDPQGAMANAHALETLMRDGLGEDGGWYEGENYHLFAHRGFWYGVQIMHAMGYALGTDARRRFERGFSFPFSGLLPDECLPSRKDSQYKVSIRQWRIAEYLELGFAEVGDETQRSLLAGLLTRVYDGAEPRVSDARSRSTADAERNESAMALTRSSLSWRALLMAAPDAPPSTRWQAHSALREHEGLSVIRREQARVFAGLEGGGDAQGHGHPDALALTLQVGRDRWLQDPGTGSYVDRSLFWYRSTLAHHAPLVNGASQRTAHEFHRATVLDFEDRGGAGWMRKRITLAGDVELTRAVIVADGYAVDVLEWSAPASVKLTLPVASGVVREEIRGVTPWRVASQTGAGGDEDGFDFLRDLHEAAVEGGHCSWSVRSSERSTERGAFAHAWYASTGQATMLHAIAPGAPGHADTSRTMLEVEGQSGRIVGVWAWSDEQARLNVDAVALTPGNTTVAAVTTADGTRAEHGAADHGWHIALVADHARSSIDLEGAVVAKSAIAVPQSPSAAEKVISLPHTWTLDQTHYVATEELPGATNPLRASVEASETASALVVRVLVHTGHPLVTQGGEPDTPPSNPLDNEPADINADSLQWYLGRSAERVWYAAGVVAPLHDGRARCTWVSGSRQIQPKVRITHSATGWSAELTFDSDQLPDGLLRFNVTINERPAWRERRRGQLRLAGGGFIRYIAGARENASDVGIILR